MDSDDEDLVETAFEALAMTQGPSDDDYLDEEDDNALLHRGSCRHAVTRNR
jgi:hypothetical protein